MPSMIHSIPETTSPETSNAVTCQSLMFGLDGRRFVIVRQSDPLLLYSAERICKRLTQLKPGDKVIYKGSLQTIKAVDVYR